MTISMVYQAPLARPDIEPLEVALAAYGSGIAVAEGRQPGPQAALEWALPVALAIIFSAPVTKFAEGFFGEAGKDAYETLKKAIRWTFHRARESSVTWRSSNGETKAQPPVGMGFDLEGSRVNFVFPNALSPDDIAVAVDKLNDTLTFIAKVVQWKKEQFTLLDENVAELYGEGFPVDDAAIHRWQILNEIAFGTWVFSHKAGNWIKVA